MAKQSEPTVQGVELERKRTGELAMSQSNLNKVYDSLGVTKQVRDAIDKADSAIMDDALQAAANEVTQNADEINQAKVTLGTGDRKMSVSVDGKKEMSNTNPRTGEKIEQTHYGYAQVRQHRQFPKSLREERLAQIEKDCEKAFKDK